MLRRYKIYQDNATATTFKPRNTNTSKDTSAKVSEIRAQVTQDLSAEEEERFRVATLASNSSPALTLPLQNCRINRERHDLTAQGYRRMSQPVQTVPEASQRPSSTDKQLLPRADTRGGKQERSLCARRAGQTAELLRVLSAPRSPRAPGNDSSAPFWGPTG